MKMTFEVQEWEVSEIKSQMEEAIKLHVETKKCKEPVGCSEIAFMQRVLFALKNIEEGISKIEVKA